MEREFKSRCHPTDVLILNTSLGWAGIIVLVTLVLTPHSAEGVLKHPSATLPHDEHVLNSDVAKKNSMLIFQEYTNPLSRQILSFLKTPVLGEETTASNKEAARQKNVVREASARPEPKRWPDQFHAQIFQNRSDHLALVDLWYDWPGGRNLNLIHSQLGSSLWDVEWTNGTSFYFDREADTCKRIAFPVGILSPDWLKDAAYLGVESVNAVFDCYVWTKDDFITYYEDVKTGLPVRWRFHSSPFQMEVLSFKVNQTLPDLRWQAPQTCFGENVTFSSNTFRQ